MKYLFGRVLSHVAGTGDEDCLAFKVGAFGLQHFHEEVHVTVTRSFGTDERTAELKSLAGEYAAEFMGQFLIHAEHVTDFASAYADITGRHIGIGTDMAIEFEHESLAETHHLGVALAARREIGTALATAHRKSGQRVFESLLESQELQNAEVYGTVETDTAFIGTDYVVMLYTVTHVGLNLAFIVHPSDAELINAIRNTKTFNQIGFFELRVFVVLLFDRTENFFYSLMILRFVRETTFQVFQNFFCIHVINPFLINIIR